MSGRLSSDRPLRALPVLLGALAAVAFLPALGAGFVNWDDEAMLLMSSEWRGLGPARLMWMFTTGFFGHWSPLVWITWAANYVLGGLDPWGYHLVNVALHALNVSLFYLVARRILASALGNGEDRAFRASAAAGALVAALLFGVHPLRVESVAWVSERRDLCCGVFYLLAALAYLRGAAGGGIIAGRWRALSLSAFAAALMCKAIAFTLPLSLLVLDVYPLRRQALGRGPLLREKVPYALLAGAAAAVAFLVRQTGGDITDYERHGPGARLAVMAYGLWFHVWKLVWPTALSPMYEMPPHVEPFSWRFVGPALALLAITAILIVLRHRWPGALAAWTHSAIVLLPISGLVHSGVQLAHDRYSYLSGLGFAILAGGAVARLILHAQTDQKRRVRAALAVAGATLALLGLGAGTWAQSQVWRDSVTLWRHGRALDPACAVCESNLGRALAESGQIAEGEAHVRRAMELRPDRVGPIENLGVIMLARGRHADGEESFRRAVALRPESGRLRNMLAVAMAHQGRYEDAAAELERARQLAPRLAEAHANLGLVRFRQGRPMDALAPLQQALAIDPTHASARATLARALRTRAVELVREGHGDQAAQLWGQAGTLAGDDPPLLRALGQALVERGKGPEAIPVLERAVALDPRSAQDRFWLARAYRLAGRAVDAEREAATLRELSPALAAELSR